MQVLITGGTGMIGRALVSALLSAGHHITIASRHSVTDLVLASVVEVIQWDGRSLLDHLALVEQTDAVINLAGANIGARLWTRARKERILESRLHAGRAITEVVEQARRKPQVVVQASGAGIYGFETDVVHDETSPPGSDWLAQVAAQWEASTAGVEALGVRQIVIRSGVVLCRESLALRRMMLPFRLLVGGPLGSGRQPFPWIHMDDEVAAIRLLMEHNETSGPYNLTAPDIVTNDQFGKVLAEVMHKPYWFRTPGWALRLVLGALSQTVLEGQRVIPRRLLELGFNFRYPDSLSALREVLES